MPPPAASQSAIERALAAASRASLSAEATPVNETRMRQLARAILGLEPKE